MGIQEVVVRRRNKWRKFKRNARARTLSLPATHQFARLRGRRILLCFGDSHVTDISYLQARFTQTLIGVTSVVAGTALGMKSRNSKTMALPIFEEVLARAPKDTSLLFCLGEVDCGSLAWLHTQGNGTDVYDEGQASLDAYFSFLESLQTDGHSDLIVMTVSMPTVVDYETWGGLNRGRSKVRATIEERTALSRWYNDQLRQWARLRNARLLDYEDDILDASTGLIDHKYRRNDPLDHHLEPVRFQDLLHSKLKDLGFV